MPTKRTRRSRSARHNKLTPAQLAYLVDNDEGLDDWERFELVHSLRVDKDSMRPGRVSPYRDHIPPAELWEAHRDYYLPLFIKEHPGKRPFPWWQWEAPEPRRRLGGVGTPQEEVLNIVAHSEYGLPGSDWVDQWQVDYYNGRAKDVHGEPIGTNYKEGNFDGVAVDPDDPPRFESQAAYLKRLGLLTKAEERLLTAEDYDSPTIVVKVMVPGCGVNAEPREAEDYQDV